MDADEFTALYREHYARVAAYCLRRAPQDEGRDAADEAFFVAWRRRDDVPVNALPWLLVVARNILADRHRRRVRHSAIAEELATCSQTAHRGADQSVVERMTVLAALAALSDRDRDALILTVWDGLAAKDAAEVAGCSATTFTVRLHRARRRLAAVLRSGEPDQSSLGTRPLSRHAPLAAIPTVLSKEEA